MDNKICPFCGGKIPKEKIKEFQSKFKAEESKIKKQLDIIHDKEIGQQKKHYEEELSNQNKQFDEFKKTLKESYDELFKEKTKTKDKDIEELKIKLKEADKSKEEIEKGIRKGFETEISKKMDEKNKEISDLKIKHTEEIEKQKNELQSQIRQLENKTPSELGSEGQTQVIDILTRTFPRDDITETKHGKAGSDIFHRINHNGEIVGLIVYEVKNVSNWNNDFIVKAKEGKTRHSANYCLLVSNVLPEREKILTEKDGVLVIHPSKVDIIARQIRHFLIESYINKLSNEQIEEKIKELQEYFTSPDYKNALVDLMYAIRDWRLLRDKERTQHDRHWADEETLNNKIYEKNSKIHTKISSIIQSKLEKVPIITKKRKNKIK